VLLPAGVTQPRQDQRLEESTPKGRRAGMKQSTTRLQTASAMPSSCVAAKNFTLLFSPSSRMQVKRASTDAGQGRPDLQVGVCPMGRVAESSGGHNRKRWTKFSTSTQHARHRVWDLDHFFRLQQLDGTGFAWAMTPHRTFSCGA
jgi:hypothetical protein